jgi:uncharacterized protein (DUF983 family)
MTNQHAYIQPIPRSLWPAFVLGLRGRCPNCGQGKMFRAFLKVINKCLVCGEELHHHRTDDAPAYFVILIVSHIVVASALAIETVFRPAYWIQFVIWFPATLTLSLTLLQPVKGAIVAVQWAYRMHGFELQSPVDD